MKVVRRLIAVVTLLWAVQLSAGCLNVYNNDLRICDQYFCPNGALTCAGCYGDALGAYYGCVFNQAIS